MRQKGHRAVSGLGVGLIAITPWGNYTQEMLAIKSIPFIGELTVKLYLVLYSISELAYFNFWYLPFFMILGAASARVPDWDLFFVRRAREEIRNNNYSEEKQNVIMRRAWSMHRQATHSISLHLIAIFAVSYYIPNAIAVYILPLVLGSFFHLIADMVTGHVPIFLWKGNGVFGAKIGIYIPYMNEIGDIILYPLFMIAIFCSLFFVQYIEAGNSWLW